MACKLTLSGIVPESAVDGPGLRFTLFAQGCPHRCPGCHNPAALPFSGGSTEEVGTLLARILENPLLSGVTFSGGEPFSQAEGFACLAGLVHKAGLNVVTFTGYTYEELLAQNNPSVNRLLSETDLLIDGPFIKAQKDLTLLFRGSANQRLLHMQKTRAAGTPVLYSEGDAL